MQSEKLLQEAIEKTRTVINAAEKLKTFDLSSLNFKETEKAWSILECLQHLNLYANFYLPQIADSISHSGTKPEAEFKSSFWGNYFAKSMLPKENMKKMKTFKNMNPLNSKLDKEVISKFISQQMSLIDLLNQSRQVNLNKVKIKTSISSLLKLNLGDTFNFLINHNLRHVNQIERITNKVNTKKAPAFA